MGQIGKHEIVTPAICASLIGKKLTDLEKGSKKALEKDADLVELRLDKLENSYDLDDLPTLDLPSIVTNRSEDEGGYFEGSEKERIQILINALEKGASCVDIELSSRKELIDEIIETAENYNASVILSYHNFDTVPSVEELHEKVRKMNTYNYDFGKIIGFSNTYEDSIRMLKFLIQNVKKKNNRKMIAFAMGERGEFTRVTAPLLGSPITYASIEEKTAPGQLSVSAVKRTLNKFKDSKEDTHL